MTESSPPPHANDSHALLVGFAGIALCLIGIGAAICGFVAALVREEFFGAAACFTVAVLSFGVILKFAVREK